MNTLDSNGARDQLAAGSDSKNLLPWGTGLTGNIFAENRQI